MDSRESREGDVIRRRRECLACGRRFTSYERIEKIPYMVVKKDGRRERFDREKILNGLLKACEKRPVSPKQLEDVSDRIERRVLRSSDREIRSFEIGQMLMHELRELDKVAYVRFASVYLEFDDLNEFIDEINQLVENR